MTAGIALSTSTGPPAFTATVSGTGFGAYEGVDVFFDTSDAALGPRNRVTLCDHVFAA